VGMYRVRSVLNASGMLYEVVSFGYRVLSSFLF